MSSLLLDRTTWDLCLDASGNIALATEPYSIGQDVSTALRTFLGECWYDTSLGVPYFQQILGKFPPLEVIKTILAAQAATVQGCYSPVIVISSITGRQMSGQVQYKDSAGAAQVTTFSGPLPFILDQSTLGPPVPGAI